MRRRRRSGSPFSLFAFQDIITSVTGVMILVTMMLALELLNRKEQSPEVRPTESTPQLHQAIAAADQKIQELEKQLKQDDAVVRHDADALRRQLQDTTGASRMLQEEIRDLQQQSEQAIKQKETLEQEHERKSADRELLSKLNDQVAATQEKLKKLRESNRTIYNPSDDQSKTAWLVQIEGSSLMAAQAGRPGPPRIFRDTRGLLAWATGRNEQSEYFVLLIKPTGVEAFDKIREQLSNDGFDIGFDLLTSDQTAIDPQTGASY